MQCCTCYGRYIYHSRVQCPAFLLVEAEWSNSILRGLGDYKKNGRSGSITRSCKMTPEIGFLLF
ncbi:Uncharacterized protein APZ42_024466 [Daphnia magna]|uniref:Uncharacterized protein n=1 Tax=Daphnia magna TaxID=35525 RepID=A0A164U0M4_9CRUS|nr:Uncharacterized protein APZ42_024466 [Daphnia magna]